MPKILMIPALVFLFLLPFCSSPEKRAVVSSDTAPQESLWYVCLRNEKIGVERILQVRAVTQAQAVDSALERARRDWGSAPIGFVWIRNVPEKNDP